MTDYEDLRDWMRRPEVQAAVERQSARAEEEGPQLEPRQLEMEGI